MYRVGPNCDTWSNTFTENFDQSPKVGPQFWPTLYNFRLSCLGVLCRGHVPPQRSKRPALAAVQVPLGGADHGRRAAGAGAGVLAGGRELLQPPLRARPAGALRRGPSPILPPSFLFIWRIPMRGTHTAVVVTNDSAPSSVHRPARPHGSTPTRPARAARTSSRSAWGPLQTLSNPN